EGEGLEGRSSFSPLSFRRGAGGEVARALTALLLLALLILAGCAPSAPPAVAPQPPAATSSPFSLDDLQHRTFLYFWDLANPRNGLVPDRWPTPSFSSIAAVGFGLTAYPIGVERGYVARDAAAQRVLI